MAIAILPAQLTVGLTFAQCFDAQRTLGLETRFVLRRAQPGGSDSQFSLRGEREKLLQFLVQKLLLSPEYAESLLVETVDVDD